MALYRLRKWITLSINGNKINWNVFKALYLEHSDVISGTYWAIDIPFLSGLPFFFNFVSLPLLHSPPSLALSPTESGWPGMSSPTDGSASSQRGAVCGARLCPILSIIKHSDFIDTLENRSSQKLMGDYSLSHCWCQWKVHERSGQIN